MINPDPFGFLITFLVVSILLCLWLLPWFIAGARGHRNTVAILMTTLLFGWTLLGWGIALIWAFTNNHKPAEASPLTRDAAAHANS